MLEGLDTIDWSSLTHAHGRATDVPKLLRSLLSEDVDVRMQACAELHETVWHQGTIYSASAAVVPFLVEMLASPGVPEPGYAVSLLGCIATGESWLQHVRRVDGQPALERRLAEKGRTLEQGLAADQAMMAAIHRDVSPALVHLLPFLSDREGLAPLVAEVLGNYPEHASWLVPAVDASLAQESDEHIRLSLAKSRARLVGG